LPRRPLTLAQNQQRPGRSRGVGGRAKRGKVEDETRDRWGAMNTHARTLADGGAAV